MPINRNVVNLTPCIQAIADKKSVKLDLTWMEESSFVWSRESIQEAIAFMASEVENLTDGKFSVRSADSVMSTTIAQGRMLYLVRCPADTPAGVVTYPNEHMDLILLGPYRDGFMFGVETESNVEIDKSLAERQASDKAYRRKLVMKELVDQRVNTELRQLQNGLSFYVDTCEDITIKQEMTNTLRFSKVEDLSIRELLTIGQKLGVSLELILQHKL